MLHHRGVLGTYYEAKARWVFHVLRMMRWPDASGGILEMRNQFDCFGAKGVECSDLESRT